MLTFNRFSIQEGSFPSDTSEKLFDHYVKSEKHMDTFMSRASSRKLSIMVNGVIGIDQRNLNHEKGRPTVFYLIHNGIKNNAHHRDFSNRKSNGNTHKREPEKISVWFCLWIRCAKRNTKSFKWKFEQKTYLYIYPWTKFVVPSRGSTIQVGSSVNSVTPNAAVVSSPMN